ncbi:MAG: peptidoglycan-binding protein [Eubacteriales bacterium]|nr:peptidoglycan-binding protein [Eubacteriales bacterium]
MKKRLLASLLCAVLLVASLTSGASTVTAPLTLRYGDTGTAVTNLQWRLRSLNYYAAAVDGKFGYSTYRAVRSFQYYNGLQVDGIVGEDTYAKLFSSSAVPYPGTLPPPGPVGQRVQYGQQGPGVTLVQGALRTLGYYAGALDGKFGYSTYLAVREFQRVNKLKVDGIVGDSTWAILYDSGAIPKPDPSAAPTELPTPAPEDRSFRIVYGDRNNLVQMVQNRLNVLGYYSGAIDSTFGYSTYLAVRAFQRANNLQVDGIVGPITWEMLKKYLPAPTTSPTASPPPLEPTVPAPSTLWLQMGSSGLQVQQLQEKLSSLHYYSGAIDGKYGYGTVVAVREFQKVHKIQSDGIVGPNTWDKLFGPGAEPKPTITPVPGVPTLKPTPTGQTPTPTPVPAKHLKYGDHNALVGQAQERLSQLGYYTGPIDNGFGYSTYQAVRSFQRYNGLKVDGVIGNQTWNRLFSPSPVPKP